MTTLQFIIIIPLLIVLITMGASIVRTIARAWLDHHVKLALLDRLERKPELLKSFDELRELLDTTPREEDGEGRIDFLLTGAMLAGIGLVCALLGALFSGRQAVGVYIGGVICAVLGFVLAMVGLAIRYLARTPVRKKRRSWLAKIMGEREDEDYRR